MFNADQYFSNIVETNKLLQDNNFKFKRVSGVKGLEEVVRDMRRDGAMFALDDSTDGVIVKGRSNPVFKRVFVCYIFKVARLNNMEDYRNNLELCREIFRQVMSKMIHDANNYLVQQINLNVDRVHFKEMEGYQLNGATGVYFVIDVDEPTSLCYNKDLWK